MNIHNELKAGCERCSDGFDLWYHYQRQRIVYQPIARHHCGSDGIFNSNCNSCAGCESCDGRPVGQPAPAEVNPPAAPVESPADESTAEEPTPANQEIPEPAEASSADTVEANIESPSDIVEPNKLEAEDQLDLNAEQTPPLPSKLEDLKNEIPAESLPENDLMTLPINEHPKAIKRRVPIEKRVPIKKKARRPLPTNDFSTPKRRFNGILPRNEFIPKNIVPKVLPGDETSSLNIAANTKFCGEEEVATTARLVRYLNQME